MQVYSPYTPVYQQTTQPMPVTYAYAPAGQPQGGMIYTGYNTGYNPAQMGGYDPSTGTYWPADANGTGPIPSNIDYRQLNGNERGALNEMPDRERAILHLWGIQMTARGFQDGGVYLNILQEPSKFKPAEVQLAQELYAKDTSRFGGITGKSLDEEFFNLSQKLTGGQANFYQRYANAPMYYAQGPVSFETRGLENDGGISGLNGYDKAILRFWGHEPLMNNGQIEGKILGYTLNSNVSLDNDVDKYYAQVLLKSDLLSDGQVNGDTIKSGFQDVLDKLYFRTQGPTVEKTWNESINKAQMNGITPQAAWQATTQGYQQAIAQGADFMKNHPVITGLTASGLLAATAVCPYLAGLGVGAMGIAAGQNWMQGQR